MGNGPGIYRYNKGVINLSVHINAKNKNDIAKTILLPGDPLRAKFIAENFLDDPVCFNEVRNMLGYTGRYKGVPVSVMGTGMGMPSMGIYSYELMKDYDVENLIRVGTAGALFEDLKLGDIVAGIAASTDSNFAHTYNLPGLFAPSASFEILEKVIKARDLTGIDFKAGNIVSCDVFYETDPGWWKKWQALGVMAVEMEAAALYMNAAYFRRNALALVSVSDQFITGESATVEERQNSFTGMMKLALETAVL